MRFIETPIFTRAVRGLVGDDDYRALQMALMLRPEQGALIRGAGGLRKVRWGGSGRGKRGGVRIIYYWAADQQAFYMLLAYAKTGNPKEPLGGDAEWTSALSGRVVDAEGRPVTGVRVHVYDHIQMSERPKYVSEKTGPDGRYAIFLPRGGTYYIAARDRFGGPPRIGDLYGRYDEGTIDPSGVVVRKGEISTGVDVTVHKVW